MAKSKFITKRSERYGYYSYFVGQNIIYFFVTFFLSIYFTNYLGIPAAIVGTILLLSRIWDAINDPLFSLLIEKTRLKQGKLKPWVTVVAILIPLSTILIFSFTNLLVEASLTVRVIYVTATYLLWDLFYTVSDAPAWAMSTVMSPNIDERDHLISFAKLFGFAGIILAVVLGPLLNEALNYNWMISATILSVAAMAFMIIVAFTKERVEPEDNTPSMKEIFEVVGKNKYLLIYLVTIIIAGIFSFGNALTPYIANELFNDGTVNTLILGASILPTLLIAPFMPLLIRKFGKINLVKFTSIIGIVLSIITYLLGYTNLMVYVAITLVRGILISPSYIIGSMFFADAVDYGFATIGRRLEAATFSLQTFSTKVTSAFSSGLALWLIALYGFKETTIGNVIYQTQQVKDGIWLLSNLGPVLGMALSLIVFWVYYDLSEDKLIQLLAKKK
jgi:glycoside/pentoside/hexuronide:cation symporter, GPH family